MQPAQLSLLPTEFPTPPRIVLAELPDVGAVLHTHSVWGTLLSDRYFD